MATANIPPLKKSDSDAVIGTLSQAMFDFDGVREDMLPFKEGDIITIIEMNENGWWKGTNVAGRVGIFPYSYVKVRTDSQESFPIVKALYNYAVDDEDSLVFNAGELITITREINADWCYGKLRNGKLGRFPLKYVEYTGNYDEETFKQESQKWELIEAEKVKQMEKIKQEKEALRLKLQQQEIERIKAEAERIKEENRKQEEALQKQKDELERLKAEQQALLQKEMNEIKERAAKAEKELEQARAEAALLRKFQENKDARKSVMVKNKIDLDQQRREMKMQVTANNNSGNAPGPPPEINRQDSFDNFVDAEDLFKDQDEKFRKNRKHVGIMQPVYVTRPSTIAPAAVTISTNVSALATQTPAEVISKQDTGLVIETEASAVNVNSGTDDKKEETQAETENKWANEKKKKNKVLSKFANLGKGPACKKCGQSVGIADNVKACGGLWHQNCFRCSTCDKIIRQGEYVDRNDNPYCLICHKKGFGPKGFGFGGTGLMFEDGVKNVDASSKESKDKKIEVSFESWV